MDRSSLGLLTLGLAACEAETPETVQIDPSTCVANYQEGWQDENDSVTLTPDADNPPLLRAHADGALAGFSFPVDARSTYDYAAEVDIKDLLYKQQLLAVAHEGSLENVDPTTVHNAYLSTQNIGGDRWPDFGASSLSVGVDMTENTGETVWNPSDGEQTRVSFLTSCSSVVEDINGSIFTPFVVKVDSAGAVTVDYDN